MSNNVADVFQMRIFYHFNLILVLKPPRFNYAHTQLPVSLLVGQKPHINAANKYSMGSEKCGVWRALVQVWEQVPEKG